MQEYKIISAGDKLKNLREKYNLSQADLAGEAITRNLISQIEHGKASLTKNAAEIMLYNLKGICKKKRIKVNEDIEYLMEDEVSQANKILDIYIEELKDLSIYKDDKFLIKLGEVEEFLAYWDIREKKIIIFELVGDYYCSINNLYKSSIYYEKAKALITADENSISILRKLSMVYLYMNKYKESIKNCDFAINSFKSMSDKYYCIFIFNGALCYLKLKEYNKALCRLKKIEDMVKKISIQKYYEVLGQEAVCLAELHEYEKSLKIFIMLADNMDKNDERSYITALVNLANNYLDVNNIDKTKEILSIINKSTSNLERHQKYFLEVYSCLGEIYERLNDITKADEVYSKALIYAKKINNDSETKSILLKLMDIYMLSKDKEKVSKIKEEYFILSAKEEKVILPIENKLTEFYLNMEDIQALRELHNFNKKLLHKSAAGINVSFGSSYNFAH